MNALIIEDEAVAAQALKSLIHEVYPEIEIVAVLQSIDETVEWFRQHAVPELVFMDIHLADGSSFSIFDEVSITCPIIFTTAYDEYALKAFEVNSIDYLLKPISKKDLGRAIQKYKNLSTAKQDNTELINKLLQSIKQEPITYKSYFLVPQKDKLIPLATSNIACIYIDTKMVKVLTLDNKTFYLDQTLEELMHQLNPTHFYRANRQYIIARKAIKDLSFWFGNKLSVNLSVSIPERILINKVRVADFKKWLAN